MSAAPAPVSTLRSVAQQVVQTSAVALFAKPSADYADKLAQAQDCLRQAAALGAVTQANSLGVEDMVITHIARQLQLSLPVFVLNTGRLHTETLALLERLQAQEGVDVTVYHPQAEAVRDYIRQHGQDALYDSIALRKQCCDLRKMEPLARALAGKKGWIPACAASNRVPARRCPWSIPASRAPSSTPWPTGRRAMSGTTWPSTAWTPTLCTTSSTPALAAPLAPAR